MAQQQNSLDALWRWMGEDMTSHQALLEEMRQEWECLKKNDLPSLLPLLQVKEAHMGTIKGHQKSMVQIVNGFLGEAAEEERPEHSPIFSLSFRLPRPERSKLPSEDRTIALSDRGG